MQYIRNAWYPLTFSHDVERAPVRRTVIEENVVLYRKEDGGVVALADRCPHRFVPLSLGSVRGDRLQCGYHGMTFDDSGKCVGIPGQELIPPNAAVKSYPVTETLGLVWIWPGEAALADSKTVYDLPQYRDTKRWSAVHGESLRIDSSYLSLTDNLTDPAHVSFVHLSTLGNPASENVPVKYERVGDSVVVHRWILDASPIPVFAKLGTFKGMVDRWHYYYFHAPSIAVIDFGSADAGAIDPERGDRDRGMRIFSCHFITPVDRRRCIDHWIHVRNFALGDQEIGDEISRQFALAFNEDKAILEAIQREEDAMPDGARPLRLGIDGGLMKMRRLIAETIAGEQGKGPDRAGLKASA